MRYCAMMAFIGFHLLILKMSSNGGMVFYGKSFHACGNITGYIPGQLLIRSFSRLPPSFDTFLDLGGWLGVPPVECRERALIERSESVARLRQKLHSQVMTRESWPDRASSRV